jgi:hypothetical protein
VPDPILHRVDQFSIPYDFAILGHFGLTDAHRKAGGNFTQSFPSASHVDGACHAGVEEWMVRRISSGHSGLPGACPPVGLVAPAWPM